MSSTPIPLPRLGVDLLSDETQMPAGAVRAAVNVDIDKRGQFKRRQGYAPTGLAGEFAGSLYAWAGRLIAYRNRELISIDPDTMAFEVLGDLDGYAPTDFTPYNGRLYVCTQRALWVLRGGAAVLAGSRLPDALPSIQAHDAGALPAGQYMAAISMLDESGEESPAVVLGQIDTQAGLLLTGLPVVPGKRWRLYLTPPNGDVLYLAEEFDAVFGQYVVAGYPSSAVCQTLNMAPMPGGDFVRARGGRLYVASKDALWFSEPLRPHMTAPRHNFVRFIGDMRFVEWVGGGVFVGDSRGVWWLSGEDPTQFAQRQVSDAVPVARSSVLVPMHRLGVMQSRSTTDCAVWLSADGYMVGAPDGQVTALHPDRIRLNPDNNLSGQSALLLRDGLQQIITLTASVGPAHVFGAAIDTAPIQ